MLLYRLLVTNLLFTLVLSFGMAQEMSRQSKWYDFSPDGKECIVLNSELPTPWLNRLSNDVFCTWITHNGFVESYLLDPLWNGLTNPQNTSGRFYIRDRKSKKYFQVNKPLEGGYWESRVGLGYNIVSQTYDGIHAKITYYVPGADNVLVMIVDVDNQGDVARDLDVFGEVEWNLGDPVKDIVYRGDGRGGSQFNLYKRTDFSHNIIFARQTNWKNTGTCIPWPYIGFFSVNEPIMSFECIKENFLGTRRNYDQPSALTSDTLSNTPFWSQAEYPIGVLHNSISVASQQRKTLVYVLGMNRNETNIEGVISRYMSPDAGRRGLEEVKAFYDSLINASVLVETPDKINDRILNIWTKYQWRQFFKKSLNTGTYGLGLWSYGLEGESIRTAVDQIILPFDSAISKSTIVSHFSNQLSDTTQSAIAISAHSMLYRDIGLDGPEISFKGKELITHRHDISEFFFPIYFYILESGDLEMLDKKFPYLDGKVETGWEHLNTAMTIALRVLSDRYIPRIPSDRGDWMDEFTMISKNNSAESIMLAEEMAFILKGLSELALRSRRFDDARRWSSVYEKIKAAVNDHGWDGQWYIRAFSDRASPLIPVGSSSDIEGKIYLNAQSWAVLSGIADEKKATSAMNAVRAHLMTEFGPKIFSPSYSKFVEHVGTQSIYAPGFRNGCIYLRPTGWAVIAACMNKQPDLAYEMYSSASISRRAENISQFECEPYVYPEVYNGPDHRLKGRGEFQWNLGEGAAWMWYSYVGYILGVRPEIDGLRIDPQIPKDWAGFKMTRVFRGNKYNLEVRNVSTGKKRMAITVNGKKINGSLIQMGGTGKVFEVVVLL